jgi:hypothetical protein
MFISTHQIKECRIFDLVRMTSFFQLFLSQIMVLKKHRSNCITFIYAVPFTCPHPYFPNIASSYYHHSQEKFMDQ